MNNARLMNAFADATRQIREALAREGCPGTFRFYAKAEGRVQTDEESVKITFNLEAGDYESRQDVYGDKPDAVLKEVIRRSSWTRSHAPLSITHVKPVSKKLVEETTYVDENGDPSPELTEASPAVI